MIDSCILIEYFRKTDKGKSTLIKLVSSGFETGHFRSCQV